MGSRQFVFRIQIKAFVRKEIVFGRSIARKAHARARVT